MIGKAITYNAPQFLISILTLSIKVLLRIAGELTDTLFKKDPPFPQNY